MLNQFKLIDKQSPAKYYVDLMEDPISIARILVEIQENERRDIARELHDRLGQSLAVLKLLLGDAVNSPPDKMKYTLGEAQSLINEMMSLTRDLSLDLRPKMLDDLGLLPALLYLFESYTSRTHINVRFEHYGLHKKLPPDISLAAYRIVEEALENVARHAEIEDAKVLAWADRRMLCVKVEDRGAGFKSGEFPDVYPGGIKGMQGRAMVVGGKLTLTSVPGEGTVVLAELPLAIKSRRAQVA